MGRLTVGLGGLVRNSCVALCLDDELVAACEQERVTRLRGAGPSGSGLPDEALDLLLARRGFKREQIARLAYAEPFAINAGTADAVEFEHHLGHAAASYLTSPVNRAVVVVCDGAQPELTVWLANGRELARCAWPWRGPGLASLYSECANVLGIEGAGHGQHFEALARLAPDARDADVDALFQLADDSIFCAPGWQGALESRRQGLPTAGPELRSLAASIQFRLGEVLLAMLTAVRQTTGETNLCVAGSLFHNSYFCSLVKRARIFDDVFVPVNPGDAGLSVGVALHAAGAAPRPISPFLGPEFSAQETKATLDNCKLHYEWLSEAAIVQRTVSALTQGYLVGWFDGPMEWGPRALGARSILASPFSPYVLENLNRFLKHRPPWRGYALSSLDEEVGRLFDGPDHAPYMECDYRPLDRELFRHVLPQPDARVRVQTVDASAPARFRAVLQAFGEVTGTAALVNTSFNGFSEPIVCNPRDAIRVYYGTGMDMLVIDRFLLVK